jgi:hypothetical protein
VVQIWPWQTVTCLHTNSPGHIWTTLYLFDTHTTSKIVLSLLLYCWQFLPTVLMVMVWLRYFVAGLLLWSSGVDLRPVCLGFVEGQVAVGWFFSWILQFPFVSIIPVTFYIHSSDTDTVWL